MELKPCRKSERGRGLTGENHRARGHRRENEREPKPWLRFCISGHGDYPVGRLTTWPSAARPGGGRRET